MVRTNLGQGEDNVFANGVREHSALAQRLLDEGLQLAVLALRLALETGRRLVRLQRKSQLSGCRNGNALNEGRTWNW